MSLNRPEPATVGAIASLLGMDRTTLTANFKRADGSTTASGRPTAKRCARLARLA